MKNSKFCTFLRTILTAFDEAQIIDRISESLKSGRFHLVIAGDGIRSDLINITNTINQGSFFSDLTLLEICIYENDNKDIILLRPETKLKINQIKLAIGKKLKKNLNEFEEIKLSNFF